MFLFISMLLLSNVLFLWMLCIASEKSKTNQEKFIEDNLQMQYLREYSLKKTKNLL